MSEDSFIYFDNNATTKVAPEVVAAMLPFFSEYYGNPSSGHFPGIRSAQAISQARQQAASFLNCNPDEILFTSCGTESDVTAILSTLKSFPEKRHIVTTEVEHPAVKNICDSLSEEKGGKYKVTTLKVDSDGRLDISKFEEALCKDTVLASIMWANNETGVIFPLRQLAEIAKKHNVLFHTDAVQAAGKISLDMEEVPVDFLSLSGHKFYAPKGIGMLYVRRGTPFSSFLPGGGQEGGRRAGTENTAYIVGLGKACELAAGNQAEDENRARRLRDKLENGLKEIIPGAMINGEGSQRLPNTCSINIPGISSDKLLQHLNDRKICASAGAACKSGISKLSPVLAAMNVPADYGVLRLSLGRYNKESEVDYFLKIFPEIVGG